MFSPPPSILFSTSLFFFYHFILIFINAPHTFLLFTPLLRPFLNCVCVCYTLSFHIHSVEIVYINDVVFVNNIVKCKIEIFFSYVTELAFLEFLGFQPTRWYIFLDIILCFLLRVGAWQQQRTMVKLCSG